jgi:TPR repeat protein
MYLSVDGITQDKAEALKWFLLAAVQAHARARNVLGVMYLSVDGITQDKAEALKWFLLVAGQGLADAML